MDTDRIKKMMSSKRGQRVAGVTGGISVAALLAVAVPEYGKLRESLAQIPAIQARLEKMGANNKIRNEKIQHLEEEVLLLDNRLKWVEAGQKH